MGYSTVVFDWDGTLMDSTWSIVNAIQSACQEMGYPVPSAQKASWVIGLSLSDALYQVVPELKPSELEQFIDHYRRHYFTQDRDIKLFDGIIPLLQSLKDRGIYLAVATGKSRAGLDRALAFHQLENMFDITRTADETRSKPDPLMLEEIMQALLVEPAQVVMIGDTSHDVSMAHYAKCDSIAVTYGAHSLRELEQSKPTRMANSVSELANLLRLYCQPS